MNLYILILLGFIVLIQLGTLHVNITKHNSLKENRIKETGKTDKNEENYFYMAICNLLYSVAYFVGFIYVLKILY